MTAIEETEKFLRGLRTRREVLGSEYVDASLAKAVAFDAPLQKLTTEWCWDEIWNRPGLDRRSRSRSILNLGMTAALNRAHEFKIHVRGALNNGLTVSELSEICLQIAVYCGMPAGIEAFRTSKEILKEDGLI